MKRRVFAAIDISDEARQAASAHIARLRTEFPEGPVRWERPEKMHITVKFAGSLDEEQQAIFTKKVDEAAGSAGPFRLKIAGTGAFIKRRGPSVLWLGVEQMSDTDMLGRIAAMLDSEENRKPYHPHITIARIKDDRKVVYLIEKHRSSAFESKEFLVREIAIYESKLLGSGSLYSKLNSFELNVG